jgi:hypothetical protein
MTGHRSHWLALLLLLAALAATVAACGGDDGDAGRATTARRAAPVDQQWRKVVPGGDCECADGSEFAFWERRADPSKVVFFLDGGGICFDAESCAFTGLDHPGGPAAYDWSIWGEDPSQEDGIFNFARADNPFRDYSFIYVPSCTGDQHLGDVTREYSPRLTVEHKGFVNGRTSLDYVADRYPDAAHVVVVGKTSISAPVYGGLAADLLPDARVTVFGSEFGHVPDDPDLNERFLGELWGAYANMPDWEVNDGLTARDWGPHGSGSKPAPTTPTSCWPVSTSPTTAKRQRGRRSCWVWTRRASSRRSTPTRRPSRRPGWCCTATPHPATATGFSSGQGSTSWRSTAKSWSTGCAG